MKAMMPTVQEALGMDEGVSKRVSVSKTVKLMDVWIAIHHAGQKNTFQLQDLVGLFGHARKDIVFKCAVTFNLK